MAKDDDMDDKPSAVEPTLDDAESDEGGEEEGGGGSKKLLIAVVAVIILLAGGGAGLYFTGALDSILGGGGAASGEHGEEDDGHGGGDDGHGGGGDGHGGASNSHFLEIPNMIVNLSGSDGQPRYLRLSVQLEMKKSSDVAAVEAVMPRVVDQFQTYLRELRVKDLRGSAGIYRLQMELLSRVNAAAYPIEVKDVLFQEILIQ